MQWWGGDGYILQPRYGIRASDLGLVEETVNGPENS